jgi:hypothetical protein
MDGQKFELFEKNVSKVTDNLRFRIFACIMARHAPSTSMGDRIPLLQDPNPRRGFRIHGMSQRSFKSRNGACYCYVYIFSLHGSNPFLISFHA